MADDMTTKADRLCTAAVDLAWATGDTESTCFVRVVAGMAVATNGHLLARCPVDDAEADVRLPPVLAKDAARFGAPVEVDDGGHEVTLRAEDGRAATARVPPEQQAIPFADWERVVPAAGACDVRATVSAKYLKRIAAWFDRHGQGGGVEIRLRSADPGRSPLQFVGLVRAAVDGAEPIEAEVVLMPIAPTDG